jgi:patatin-like phospholipase/acyl hydrolase
VKTAESKPIDMDLFKTEDAKAEVKKEEESKLKQKKETAQEDKDFTDFFKLLNQRKKVDF